MDEPPPRRILSRALDEIGLVSMYHSSTDVKLLCMQRFVRLFAYGASTLVLVLHLQTLGVTNTRIGLFMTLTLAGDVLISLILTLVADAVGRKAILAMGATLMVGAGTAFALFDNFWILLVAAILGVISPSGTEIGPFRAIEESVVAHLTDAASRSDVYAWYTLLGTAGSAFGLVTCGWSVHHLANTFSWPLVDAYRAVFVAYAALGLVKLALSLLLSPAVEVDAKPASLAEEIPEAAPLLSVDDSDDDLPRHLHQVHHRHRPAESLEPPREQSRLRALLPTISPESYKVLTTLSLLFGLDAFASGLASLSWLTYFFHWRYGIEEGRLGSIFFTTSIIAAASMLVASSLAKRIGNVKTMVFTHLPSSIFLAMIGIPNNARLSLLFLFLRSCSQSMDTGPRTAFVAAIILPEERTAMMGAINVVKTLTQGLGPLITGVLSDHGLFWVAFLCAGSFKACYDLGLLAVFKNYESRQAEEQPDDRPRD